MRKALIRISKFVSLVLRHDPGRIGLRLDENGWAEVSELLSLAEKAGRRITRDELVEVVESNEKQRFALSEDGTRIRANQGHSIEVELGLEASEPPKVLYHGTATRNLESIRERGLVRGARQHVHLSTNAETATSVGQRHGTPVVLEVLAAEMARVGHEFFCSKNGVWLTEAVPAKYLSFP